MRFTALPAITFLFCFTAAAAEPAIQDPAHEQLAALKYFLGDWELDGQFQMANQPAVLVKFERHIAWMPGENYFETRMTEIVDGVPRLWHKSIIGWEADTERISEWGFWNGDARINLSSGSERVTWTRQGKTWQITREGVNGLYTIVDRDTHRYEAEFRLADGSQNCWSFTAKRKKASARASVTEAPHIPPAVLEQMNDLSGSWQGEGEINGKKQAGGFTARWVTAKDGKKVCLVADFSYVIDGVMRTGKTLFGWNAARQCIEDRGFDTQGGNGTLYWKPTSPEKWDGEMVMVNDGQAVKWTGTLQRNPTEAIMECKSEQGDTWRFVFHKQGKPLAK